jgi:hypothetical protein
MEAVSLGLITKQLAQEALGSQLKELTEPAAQTPAPTVDNAAAMIAEIQKMQGALKEDQELVVTCHVGRESVRVMEMFAPTPKLVVLTGFDADRALTRVVSPVDALQLICKPTPVKPGAKPVRLRLVATAGK